LQHHRYWCNQNGGHLCEFHEDAEGRPLNDRSIEIAEKVEQEIRVLRIAREHLARAQRIRLPDIF